jgi:hypothetical protein
MYLLLEDTGNVRAQCLGILYYVDTSTSPRINTFKKHNHRIQPETSVSITIWELRLRISTIFGILIGHNLIAGLDGVIKSTVLYLTHSAPIFE